MSRMTGPQVSAVAAATVLLTAIALAGAGRGCSSHAADDAPESFPLDTVVIDSVAADTEKVSPRKVKRRGTTHRRKPVVRSHRDEVVSDTD